MCMEDYRIARALHAQVYALNNGTMKLTVKARADRTTLYVWCDAGDNLEIWFGDDTGGQKLWVSASPSNDRTWTIAELGPMLLGAFTLNLVAGVGPATAIETWLQDH